MRRVFSQPGRHIHHKLNWCNIFTAGCSSDANHRYQRWAYHVVIHYLHARLHVVWFRSHLQLGKMPTEAFPRDRWRLTSECQEVLRHRWDAPCTSGAQPASTFHTVSPWCATWINCESITLDFVLIFTTLEQYGGYSWYRVGNAISLHYSSVLQACVVHGKHCRPTLLLWMWRHILELMMIQAYSTSTSNGSIDTASVPSLRRFYSCLHSVALNYWSLVDPPA